MPRRRDRHDRGFRGPLAAPGSPARAQHRSSRNDFFQLCLTDAIARVLERCPTALDHIEVGIEEVPYLTSRWSGDRVPLAAGLEADRRHPARVVLYQRPIEYRATTRTQLRELVHRTLVEQLATLTVHTIRDLGGMADWD